MNERSDINRVLSHWFDDGPSTMPDRVVDIVAERISRQGQRRTWRLRGRPFMNTYAKLAAAAAAVVVVGIVGWRLLPGDGGIGGPPTPPPTAVPTASAQPSPTLGSGPLPEGKLAAGHYTITPPINGLPGLMIEADIPAGWTGHPDVPALTSPSDSETSGGLIGFMPGEGLFSDPCHWDIDGTGSVDQDGDVDVGTSVDDLVQALQANTSYTTSTPSAVTIGGFGGAVVDLQLPGRDALAACDGDPAQQNDHKYIVLTRGFWAQGPDSRWRLFILDVEGTRLITMISSFGALPQAELDAAQAIVESFEISTGS